LFTFILSICCRNYIVNYFFISLFHFLFIKANIKKHDTKDKEMICIIIVVDMIISLIGLYIYYLTTIVFTSRSIN